MNEISLRRASLRPFEIAPDDRESVLFSAALWLGTFVFITVGGTFSGATRSVGEYLSPLTGAVSALAVAMAAYLIFKRLAGVPNWFAYCILAVLIVVCAMVQTFLDFGGYWVLAQIFPNTQQPPRDLHALFLTCTIYAGLYTTNITLIWVTAVNRAMREQALRLAAAEANQLRAELHVLRLKLSPHFMFNALGAASGLIDTGHPAEGSAMLNRLSGFLRASFDVGVEDISLEDELSIVDDYLEVERVRFADRMRVRMDVDEGLRGALVPSLLLQPLVENAVRYGVAPASTPVTITIRGLRLDDRLLLSVEDDGRAATDSVAPGTGLGQAATRSRLSIRYAGAADFTAGREGDSYKVVITLPLVFA